MAKATAVKKGTGAKIAAKKPAKKTGKFVVDVSDKPARGASKAAAIPTFKVGDPVKWSSSAMGSMTTKTGVVVAVIPGGKKSADTVRQQLKKYEKTHISAFGFGGDRDQESYLVSVPQGVTGKAKPKLYWPRTQALAKA